MVIPTSCGGPDTRAVEPPTRQPPPSAWPAAQGAVSEQLPEHTANSWLNQAFQVGLRSGRACWPRLHSFGGRAFSSPAPDASCTPTHPLQVTLEVAWKDGEQPPVGAFAALSAVESGMAKELPEVLTTGCKSRGQGRRCCSAGLLCMPMRAAAAVGGRRAQRLTWAGLASAGPLDRRNVRLAACCSAARHNWHSVDMAPAPTIRLPTPPQ